MKLESYFHLLVTMAMLTPRVDGEHRRKRFVFFDTQSPVNIGLLVTVPFGVALPLAKNSIKPFQKSPPTIVRFKRKASTKAELERVTWLLDLLEVEGFECRLRFIHDLASNQEEFDPISTIVLSPLRLEQSDVRVEAPGVADEYEMYQAALFMGRRRVGVEEGYWDFAGDWQEGVLERMTSCPTPAKGFLNMDALRVWRMMSKFMKIRFVE